MGHGTTPDIVVLNYDNLKETYTTLVANQKKQDIADIFQSTDLYKALVEVYKNISFVSYKTQSLGQGLGNLGFLSLEINTPLDKDQTRHTLSTIFAIPAEKIIIKDDDFLEYTIRTGPSNILYLKVHKNIGAPEDLYVDNTISIHGNQGIQQSHEDAYEEKDRSNPHVVHDYIRNKIQKFASLGEVLSDVPKNNYKKSISFYIPVVDPFEDELKDDILSDLGVSTKDALVINELNKRTVKYTHPSSKYRIFIYLCSEAEPIQIQVATKHQYKPSYNSRDNSEIYISDQSVFSPYAYDKRMAGQIPSSKDTSPSIGTMGYTRFPTDNVSESLVEKITHEVWAIKKDTIREAFMGDMFGPHRLNPFMKIGNVHYINDSAAINPNAAWYALQSLPGPIVWIIGGVYTGTDISDIFKDIPKDKIHSIINISVDNTLLHQLQHTLQGSVDTFFSVKNMDEVALLSRKLTQSGNCTDIKTVLLSPACPGFDLFESYEDRGRQFMDAVRNNS